MAFIARRPLLKQRLKLAGKTQAHLARHLEVTRQRVNDWANGRRPIPFNTQKDIAEFIGCSIDDLWEWVEVPRERVNRDDKK